MSQNKPKNPIQFRQGQVIGQPAAEDDDEFLFDTFYEHFAFKELSDVKTSKFLLVGRTGTGKTAILRNIESKFDRVIRIDPQELSLQYISNSDIITFFQKNGVKLDLFYQLLWRHVIATELIKVKFRLDDAGRTRQFFDKVGGWFNVKRKRALEYMRSFGSDFWLETDARVTQVTQKFESELTAAAGVDLSPLKTELGTKSNFSEEQTRDIVTRAQKVVDSVHIQQLSEVIDWLNDEVFDDRSAPFYVLIDDLDLPFASGEIKLHLVRALIETAKKFRKVANVKIVVSIRTDLIERVFDLTREDGFQEEKYKGNIIEIEWAQGELKELVDRRIKESIKRRYTNVALGFTDIFPDRINQGDGFSYMVQRTLHRPRDIIAFVNECLSKSVGSDRVNFTSIRKAEEFYSTERFNALKDEWFGQFPLLELYVRPLTSKPRRFPISLITHEDIDNLILQIATSAKSEFDVLGRVANNTANYGGNYTAEFRLLWIDALYKVGVLGIKTDPRSSVKWNYRGRQTLNVGDVADDSMIYIHPMLWRRLGIITKDAEIEVSLTN